MVKKHVFAVLGTAVVVGSTVFASSAASRPTRTAADDPNNAKLTYWYWAESDAPGANGWLKKQVAAYEKAHPKVKITVVIQSTDTLTSAFTTAAQTKSGPDIATQWATLPTLTPAWSGASVPISDYVPASETKNWIGTPENMSSGKLWAMPQYLLGIPFVWNKVLFKKAGLDPNKGPKTWADFLADAKKLKAAGITPFGMGNKDGYGGAWFFSLIGKQNLNSINELKDAMIGKANFAETKFSGFYTALADLKKKGYLNSDVASISFEQGFQLFGQKKVGMSWGTDGVLALAGSAQGVVRGDRRLPGRQAFSGFARDRPDREEDAGARSVGCFGLARELRAAAGRPERRPRRRRAHHVRLGLARAGREALDQRALEVEEPAPGRVP